MCFLCGFVSFLSLSFFCPLCFLFSFSLLLSLLLGFTNLERNRFSPDYIDLRGGPPSLCLRLPPHPQGGDDSGARPVPRADLFGPGHTTIRDSNSARKQQPIGQGAEALLPNEKGCCGTQSYAASGEAARPRRTRVTIRLYSRIFKLVILSFNKAPGCSSNVSERKRIQRLT